MIWTEKRLILISIAFNILLFGSVVLLMKGNTSLRDVVNTLTNTFITEVGVIRTRTMDNGSEIATVQTQMVTKEMMRALEYRLGQRMEDMDIKMNKKLSEIILYNTVTTYHIKDSNVVITDTSYVTHYKDKPWIEFKHQVYPLEGYSETDINLYDSLIIVGTWDHDKTYWWPKRLWKPKIGEVTVNNANPYSKVSYFKHYKIMKDRRD